MIPCICINDANRPPEIVPGEWVKLNEHYHITFIAWLLPQKVLGVSLYELPLDETCMPYEYFTLSRFAIPAEALADFITLAKDCQDLDGLDIRQLILESQTAAT